MGEKSISYTKGKTENKVSIEFLKKEMAQYLQIDNLNFLFGAGCSSYIEDGVEMGIPGMAALYNQFFEENPDFQVAGKKVKGDFEHNLEKMLEVMGAVQVANQINTIDPSIDDNIKLLQKFIRNQIKAGLSGEKVLELFRDFYLKTVRKGRKSPINIFTTNYDLYNEMALDALGFPYNNGFVGTYNRQFNPLSYKYAFVENMNLSRDVWERVPSFYNLYKLHGSISWLKKDEQIWETNYDFIGEDETVMIYPTPLKDRTTLMTPYSDLFRSMENSLLKKNSMLITFGYSFGDDHINRVILNSLAIPSFRLVIFGKSPAIDKLAKLGDSRIVIINSESKIHYFNNIVNQVMPDVQDDMVEEIMTPSASGIIKSFEDGESNE